MDVGVLNMLIQRNNYIDKIYPFVDTEVIKVITGLRRSGKSYMLELIKERLLKDGRKPDQFISINFEKNREKELKEVYLLSNYLESRVEISSYEKVYIFLDEIQEVTEFERVINSLRATFPDKVDIYITGSNSQLLSGELATLIGGRYVQFVIYPFRFSEYLTAKGTNKKQVDELFSQYIIEGGMPFLATQSLPSPQHQNYLEAIYDSAILNDVIERETIRKPGILKKIFEYVLNNIGRIFSARNVSDYLKREENIEVSPDTVLDYLEAGTHAYLILPIKRYDIQGKKLLSTQQKYYVVDHGFREAIVGRNQQDIELILENVVLLELLARDYKVTVGRTNKYEVDFIAEKRYGGQTKKLYIQVSYLISSDKTHEREFRSLQSISDNYRKIVLSLSPIPTGMDGIEHIKLYDFLLDPEW